MFTYTKMNSAVGILSKVTVNQNIFSFNLNYYLQVYSTPCHVTQVNRSQNRKCFEPYKTLVIDIRHIWRIVWIWTSILDNGSAPTLSCASISLLAWHRYEYIHIYLPVSKAWEQNGGCLPVTNSLFQVEHFWYQNM